jgi:hypothetical protein
MHQSCDAVLDLSTSVVVVVHVVSRPPPWLYALVSSSILFITLHHRISAIHRSPGIFTKWQPRSTYVPSPFDVDRSSICDSRFDISPWMTLHLHISVPKHHIMPSPRRTSLTLRRWSSTQDHRPSNQKNKENLGNMHKNSRCVSFLSILDCPRSPYKSPDVDRPWPSSHPDAL